MTNKKSKLWRFIFSLLPGAGEMYMGFMKMGVSLMGLFFAIITIATFFRVDFLIFMCIVVWFYSFFHVHNLAGMPEEEFYAIKDEYLFHLNQMVLQHDLITRVQSRGVAVVMIVIGGYLTLRSIWNMTAQYLPPVLADFIYSILYDMPQLLAGIGIIALGVHMIRGKKKELDNWENSQIIELNQVEENTECQ